MTYDKIHSLTLLELTTIQFETEHGVRLEANLKTIDNLVVMVEGVIQNETPKSSEHIAYLKGIKNLLYFLKWRILEMM